MRPIILFILQLIIIAQINAQPNWLISAGGNSNDEATKNISDAAGNIYTTGYFGVSAKFGNTIVTSAGSRDIFITRQSQNGGIKWVKRAGGSLSDKPYNISTDNKGRIFITGYFTGQATFGNITLNALNNSQDVFIACLDTAGNFMWAKRYGSTFADIASGIACDRDGNVIITGQFKGTMQAGSSTYTSLTNPFSAETTYDIFIIKLSSSGNLLWSKHGKGIYEDRGVAVCTDSSSAIYVTGQYSDNLTFSQSYPNNGFNAGFIMKLDSMGTEKWFRSLYATQLMVYDIKVKDDRLFAAGDFQGQLYISGNPPSYLNNGYTYKIFVANLDTAGNVGWIRADGSDNPLSLHALAVDNNKNTYLTGTFKCSFSEYSSVYGEGVFMSAGYEDVFLTQYNINGERVWARQFGGASHDDCHAVTVLNVNKPVIAGSFERTFNVPKGNYFATNTSNYDSSAYGPAQSNVCGDPEYGKYISIESSGNKDVFLSSPFDPSRSTYDFWDRSSCLKDSLEAELALSVDTFFTCTDKILELQLHTGTPGIIGPDYSYLWNTGDTTAAITSGSSGLFSVTVSSKDGCMSSYDQIYVHHYPEPATPSISYSTGTFKQAIPGCLNNLNVMLPSQVTLTASNITPGYQHFWSTPYGNQSGTSITAIVSGSYTFVVSAPGGLCVSTDCIDVLYYNFSATGGDTCSYPTLVINLEDSVFQVTDTVTVCLNEFFTMYIGDSLPNTTIPNYLNFFADWTITGGYQFHNYRSFPSTFGMHKQEFVAKVSGECTATAVVLDPITLSILDTVTRTFYLKVNEPPAPNVQFTGPSMFCPGDTVTLSLSGANEYDPKGPGIIQMSANNDTIVVTKSGLYSTEFVLTDSITGCTMTGTATFQLNSPSEPGVTMSPANGVVCPGDSVLLTADAGSAYRWFGPMGNVIGTTQSIYVTIPGEYHYDMTDPSGCFLISSTEEVKEFTTPFVAASPAAILCPRQSITLSVISNDTTAISWYLPLSGNSTSVTVSDTGVYVCSVSGCGVVTTDSVHISYSTVTATILQGDSITVCPGSQYPLQAEPGYISYSWNGGSGNQEYFNVDAAGTYVVSVTDEGGCTDTDTIIVSTYIPIPTPLINDTVVCKGSSVTLSAISSYQVSWYNAIHELSETGAVLVLTPIVNDTTLFVTASDSVCESEEKEVHVVISPASVKPVIIGDSTYCTGDQLTLTVDSSHAGLSFQWITSQQVISTDPFIQIINADTSNAGYYFVTITDGICSQTSDSILIIVHARPVVSITGTASACEDDTITLTATTISGAFYTWNLPDNTIQNSQYLNITSATIADSGYYTVSVSQHNCPQVQDSFHVSVTALPVIQITGDSIYCKGNILQLGHTGTADLFSWNINEVTVTATYILANTDTVASQMVTLTGNTNGCETHDSLYILVSEGIAAEIIGDSIPCEGSQFHLGSAIAAADYSWTGPAGFSSAAPQLDLIAASATAGTYILQVTDTLGCPSSNDTITIDIKLKPVIDLGHDIVLCTDSSITLSVVPGLYNYEWNGIQGTNSFLCEQAMTITLIAYSGEGCSSSDTVIVSEINCTLQFPNVFSPNGDGKNDTYKVINTNGRLLKFELFNRWGKPIATFESDFEWNGKDNNMQDVAAGVYFYTAVVLNEKSEPEVIKGFIELFR